MTLHPWRVLRAMPHVTLTWQPLPGRLRGLSDGRSRIWLDTGLLQRERRCTLAHELIHLREAHEGCQPPSVERWVRHQVSLWLLPDLDAVLDELVFHHGDPEAAAVDLWVDRATVEARLDSRHLHPAERAEVMRRLSDH